MPGISTSNLHPLKLYKVFTTIPVLERLDAAYEDVTLRLLVVDRIQPIGPYDLLIDGYRDNGCYQACQAAVDEAFTRHEAEAARGYIRRTYDMDASVEPLALPLPLTAMAKQHVTPGPARDFIRLCEGPNYDLPVKLWAYFDLTGCARRPLEAGRPASRGGVADAA